MSVLFVFLLLATACVCNSASDVPSSYTELSHIINQRIKEMTSEDPEDRQSENIEMLKDPGVLQQVTEAVSGLSGRLYENLQNGSSQCADDMGVLFSTNQRIQFKAVGLNVSVSQGLLAIDASGKPVPEILLGNINFNGGYDECMTTIDTSAHQFGMQYSTVSLVFIFIETEPYSMSVFPVPMTEGLCIPDSCTTEDINGTMQTINQLIMGLPIPTKVLIWPGEMTVKATQRDLNVKYSAGAIVMIFISCLFVAMAGIGSGYDLYCYYTARKATPTSCILINETDDSDINEDQPLLDGALRKESPYRGFFRELLQSFSLYKTVPAILSTNQPPSAITSINGMRVISMFWVIMCHSYAFYMGAFKNIIYVYTGFTKRFSAQAILNGYFSVDSFFFLSGLLVAYLTFREMERKSGRFPVIAFYIHRIARLTPVYMYVLFFYWFLTVHITDGPNTQSILGENSQNYNNCAHNWWSNLLYINNFYPTQLNESCMGWTWYLANDMQFYVISPLFLLPLYYYFPVGVGSLVICLLSSLGITGFIAGYYGYYANTLYVIAAGGKPLDPNLPDQMDEIYVKPYCRITPYLVGLFLGYVLYKKHRITIPASHLASALIYAGIWLVAIVLGIVNVYGLYPTFHGHKPTPTGDVMYYMLSRFAWGVTLALVVYACHNGFGGVVNRFLSLPFWIPLGRLTYTAYLVHEVVLLLLLSEMRDNLYYSDMMLVVHIIANVVLSFGAAFAISLLVEFPMSNVERAIFKFFGNPLRASTRISASDRGIITAIAVSTEKTKK